MRTKTMTTTIPTPSVLSQGERREWIEGVTFKAFRWLALRVGWTPDTVAALLVAHGANGWGGPREGPYYEAPKAYLHRVLRRGHTIDDDQVIPYHGLIALYVEATTPAAVGEEGRRCACGCGSPVFPRHRYASRTCRQRVVRRRPVSEVRDVPEGRSPT
jgi:hypothetical protein